MKYLIIVALTISCTIVSAETITVPMGNGAFVTYDSVKEYNKAVKDANEASYNRYFDPETNRKRIHIYNMKFMNTAFPPKGRRPIDTYDYINKWDKKGFGFNKKMTYKSLMLLTDADTSHLDKYHKDFITWVKNWIKFDIEKRASSERKLQAEKADYKAWHKTFMQRVKMERIAKEKAQKEKRQKADKERAEKRELKAEKLR